MRAMLLELFFFLLITSVVSKMTITSSMLVEQAPRLYLYQVYTAKTGYLGFPTYVQARDVAKDLSGCGLDAKLLGLTGEEIAL